MSCLNRFVRLHHSINHLVDILGIRCNTTPKKVRYQYYQDQDRSNFFARYCFVVPQTTVPMNPPCSGSRKILRLLIASRLRVRHRRYTLGGALLTLCPLLSTSVIRRSTISSYHIQPLPLSSGGMGGGWHLVTPLSPSPLAHWLKDFPLFTWRVKAFLKRFGFDHALSPAQKPWVRRGQICFLRYYNISL